MSRGRALILAGCLLAAAPASAQVAFDARGYFTYGVTIFSAAETLDAVRPRIVGARRVRQLP